MQIEVYQQGRVDEVDDDVAMEVIKSAIASPSKAVFTFMDGTPWMSMFRSADYDIVVRGD